MINYQLLKHPIPLSSKISALVITHNEANNIKELIENLHFSDEIIIVDSFSTDNTMAILKNYSSVRVYQHKFKDFSSQRNIALSYASHEWILFIDADERISENLKKEILETVTLENSYQGYFFKRKFYFLNKRILFSGLRTDKNLRLFKKEGAIYHGLVHEKLNIKNTGTFKNFLTHFSYTSHLHFKSKIIYYNKLKALEKITSGKKHSLAMEIFHPIYTFLNRYLFRLGILDGRRGFIICKIYSEGISERYKEMKRLKKEQV